mmetsp:Transcript_18168/g.43716  ORF Transcript_18168/g.43716 Transcript_18168/m.43716 type:complete len:307 (-) Transcript_18168:1206-2126(-)
MNYHLAQLKLVVPGVATMLDFTDLRVVIHVLKADVLRSLAHSLAHQPQNQRFGNENHGYRESSQCHEKRLYLGLALVQRMLLGHSKPHPDKGVDNGRRIIHGVHPFVHDHEIHVPEEAEHEHRHGHTLEQQIQPASEIDCIQKPQEEAQHHVRDPEQNCKLHFQAIHIQQFVGSTVPRRVHPELVDLMVPGELPGSGFLGQILWFRIRGIEQHDSHTDNLTVHQPCVYCEEPHQSNHVPSSSKGSQGIAAMVAEVFTLHAEPEPRSQQAQAVAHITKHDPEDKRKRHHSENCGVNFLIPWDTVGVH